MHIEYIFFLDVEYKEMNYSNVNAVQFSVQD
jgi:hypothetical protein